MLKIGNRRSPVISAIGFLGLMMSLTASTVSAQFSNANYTGRYTCNEASILDFYTAVIRYTPNGAGGYTDGVLIASLEPFASPTMLFCTYLLQPVSNYAIDTTGVGFEMLTWGAAVGNNALCPASFVDETATALRSILNANGASIRAEFASANLLNSFFPGHGTCVQ